MRSSPLMLALLLLIAAGLVAAVFLAGTAPASCKQADEGMHSQLVAQASNAYQAILKDEPDSSCAAAGMRDVEEELCSRGRKLARAGQTDAARKVYESVLATDLPHWDPQVDCALKGLDAIPTPSPSPAPAPVCGCKGEKGSTGKRGRRGRRGVRGPAGPQGPPGASATSRDPGSCSSLTCRTEG